MRAAWSVRGKRWCVEDELLFKPSLIPFQAGTIEHRLILIIKRCCFVMLALLDDVIDNHGESLENDSISIIRPEIGCERHPVNKEGIVGSVIIWVFSNRYLVGIKKNQKY